MNPVLNGPMLCARYAFAPNFYCYCGPDTKGEMGEYLKEELVDGGLVGHLSKFETLYPYLTAIAQANGIADPLDARVVEAYWVGNDLLERVDEKAVYATMTDILKLEKRLPKKEMKWLLPKIDKKATLHHSFHVLNVFTRTGHHTVEHTVETMDECRISWGEILQDSKLEMTNDKRMSNSKIKIRSQKLMYRNGQLQLVPTTRCVTVSSEALGMRLKTGDMVSVHWGFVCDRLTQVQVKRLERYTKHHLALANTTI
jgi:hypothetical protein